MTGAIGLAMVCIATLVLLVHHIATSINVERVVDAPDYDLVVAVETGTRDAPGLARVAFAPGSAVTVAGSNYLRE